MKKISLFIFLSFCFAQVGVSFLLAASYRFADPIESYPVNGVYSNYNAHVELLANNGGNPVIQTTIGNFSTSGSDRMLEVTSGIYNQYTDHGAGGTDNGERYGQIFFRIGKSSAGANWVRCTLYDGNNNSGPVVMMDPNGLYRYYNLLQEIITTQTYSLTSFEEITINYDLQLKTYSVWIGSVSLVSGASFKDAGFTTPNRIVIGGAYWTPGPSAALDQWYWKVSNDIPFTSYDSKMVNVSTTPSPFFINLGDYAKGDGTDETQAIQRAIDALPPSGWQEGITANHPGGILYIPRPKTFYGISATIRVIERWNCSIICESPSVGSRGTWDNYYFRWLGLDNTTMFEFRSSSGIKVENLSLDGMGRNVTGILLGQEAQQTGFQTGMIFDHLKVTRVANGIKLGDFPNNGPDVREITFRNAFVGNVSAVGIIAASGNLANVTFETLTISANPGAQSAIRIDGGEILILNYNSTGTNVTDADIVVNNGGLQVVKAWSEWWGPFLRTSIGYPEWTPETTGTVFFSTILEGVRHYETGFLTQKQGTGINPVPTSINYNRPIPLHLIGCSLWGKVELGTESMATIIDHGTVFIDKDCIGFTGTGITTYGRVIHIGTRHPQNARILEPYVVDRRSVPGTGPPTSGTWQKGDRIVNIDPDRTVPSKAWGGWICLVGGTPGTWAAYGKIQ